MNKLNSKLSILMLLILSSGCNPMYYILSEGPYIEKKQRETEEYIKKHPELDDKSKETILDNKIDLGFTKEQVRLSTYYDHPDKIKTTTDYGADEVWIYHRCWNRDVKPFKRGHATISVLSFWTLENLYFKDNTLIKIEIINTDKRCR